MGTTASSIDVVWLTAFLDTPAADLAAGCAFWQAVTSSTLSRWRDGGRFATLHPREGHPFLRVQRLDDGSAGIHLDLHVDDVAAAARAAMHLGATPIGPGEPTLHVLKTPGGQPFCLTTAPAGTRPRDREMLVDQVCLDIPDRLFGPEASFWSALTGWSLEPSTDTFVRLRVPGRLPLRILLQTIADEPRARAHLDIACRDVDTQLERQVALGAVLIARHPRWTHLCAPSGHHFCLTARNPATGRL